MSLVHFHLLFNHVPIFLLILGGIIVLVNLGFKSRPVHGLALALIVLSALWMIPVFLTGEGAEEGVEELAGVRESDIESHEEAAKTTLLLTEMAGVVALIALVLFMRKANASRYATAVVIALVVGAGGSAAYTGSLGGSIRHTELKNLEGPGHPAMESSVSHEDEPGERNTHEAEETHGE